MDFIKQIIYYIRWIIGKFFKVLAIFSFIAAITNLHQYAIHEDPIIPFRLHPSNIAGLFFGSAICYLIGWIIDVRKKKKEDSE